MSIAVTGKQNVNDQCFVCGTDNPFSLKAAFLELENGELETRFYPTQVHSSYPGRVHGGVVTAIIDETICRALQITHPEIWGVTVELTTKFRKPLPYDTELICRGRVDKLSKRIMHGSAEIYLPDGTKAAEGKGVFAVMPIESIVDENPEEVVFMPDTRVHPSNVPDIPGIIG